MTVEMAGNFTRELDSLPQVLDLVEHFFSKASLEQKDRYPIELAVEEVFTNFVEHNSGGSDRCQRRPAAVPTVSSRARRSACARRRLSTAP
jgi:hypothetical protein